MNDTRLSRQRTEIAKKVRQLREGRRITQEALSAELGLSQGRYSVIERGNGSFSAEQFLEILRIFNVSPSYFAVKTPKKESVLQNALARLGAWHLVESQDALPDAFEDDPAEVVKEVLLGSESPRQIAALAPVLVAQFEKINFQKLWTQFVDFGFEGRLGWLLENTVTALRSVEGGSRKERLRLSRAEVIFQEALDHAQETCGVTGRPRGRDILEPVYSSRSLNEDWKSGSEISQKWNIVSSLLPSDFRTALEAARASH